MQVSVESTSTLERRMKVQVPAEQVDKEVQSRLREVSKTARLDGFRKGKVPISVVRKRFGGQVHREVMGDLIQSSYADALTQEKLRPASQPAIEPSSVEEGKDLEYTAVFEVYPEPEIKQLDGLEIEQVTATISDGDLDEMIETLRKQRATWEESDSAAVEGDRVTIGFVGTIDGEEFEGGKADDYPVTIGAGQLLPDLEQGLVGLKAGDEKSIDVAFPDNYQAAELAGKTAAFAVTVAKVEVQVLPEINQDFIKEFGEEDTDLDGFRASVKDNMQRELDERLGGMHRQAVLNAFWAANEIELPKALVEEEAQQLLEDSARRMGLPDASQLPKTEAFDDEAKRRVGLGLLIGKVIEGESVKVESDKVDAKLDDLTASYQQADDVKRQYRSNPQMMQQIEMLVLEEQVVEMLTAKGNVAVKEQTFSEVMGR